MSCRNQFTFYKSFDDIIEDLSDKQLAEYMRVMVGVQFLRIKIEDVKFTDKTLSIVWKSQKHSIEKSIKGYLDGQNRDGIKNPYLGIYDPLCNPSEGVAQQVQVKEEVKEKGQVQAKEELPDWLDKKAWSEWVQHRKELKKALTKSTINKQLAFLEKDILIHIAIINQSIQNGWAGLFDLKQKQTSSPSTQRGKMVGGFYV